MALHLKCRCACQGDARHLLGLARHFDFALLTLLAIDDAITTPRAVRARVRCCCRSAETPRIRICPHRIFASLFMPLGAAHINSDRRSVDGLTRHGTADDSYTGRAAIFFSCKPALATYRTLYIIAAARHFAKSLAGKVGICRPVA